MYQLKLKHLLFIPFFLIFSISEIYADHISVYGDDSTGRIPDTGLTKCYDNEKEIPCPNPGEDFYGQDANYNINPQSFSKLDAQANELPYSATEWTMVRDNVTGLIWEVKTDDGSIHDKDNKYTWYDSNPETNGGYTGTNGDGTDTEDFIKSLNESNYGGFSDWRLPSLKELVTIVHNGEINPATNKSYFPKIRSEFYWSSTSRVLNTGYAWGVYFYYGDARNRDKDSSYYVRAVRGGQCRSFDHSVNLVINTDETVTDTFTGLMWQKESTETRMTWQNAIEYCENMSLSDYNDWRLPTMHELRSIVNYLKYYPAMNQDFFSGILSSFYWSSTSNANFTGNAWGVQFYNGINNNYAKDSSNYVRAVRGGQNRLFDHLVIGSPEQASKWQPGDKMPIKWDTQNIQGNVNISISREGGKTDTFIPIASNTPNDGEFEWTVTQQASVNCMLKIEPVNEPDKGTSQGLFSITATQPPLTVCSSNCDYTSIQLAIEGATLRDKVLVSDGTYVENINFKGKNITIQSENGPEKTIIQANLSNSVITFNFSEHNAAILKGFTIKSGISANGGGIYISGASPVISECIISNNNADNKGGGVYCENALPKFVNCIFHNNTAETGHALYLYRSSPEIINCTISQNGYPIGEGIVIYDAISSPVILNSILWNNGDEIILQNNATVTVEYSNIEGGYSGIGNIQNDPLFIDADHNNFHILYASPCVNSATNVNAPNIDIDYQERPIDEQFDIGADEASKNTKPVANFSTNSINGTEPLEIIFENLTASQEGIITNTWNFGDGITSTVQSPTHSYTQEGIFTVTLTVYEADGDTDTTSLTITVLDTDPIANFTANQTTGFAPINVQFTNLSTSYDGFESHWSFGDGTISNELNPLHAFSSGDYTVTLTVTEPDGDTSTKMISNMIQVYAIREICASGCEYTSIQMAVNESRSGDRISVKPGTYSDTLDFQGKAIRIESTNGSNVTTIDAENNDAVVRFANQETNASILKGFTLKNGLSDFGGGIFVDNAAPVIENCRIIHNQAGSGGGLYLTNGASPKLSNCAVNDNIASNGAGVFIDHSNILFSQTTINFNIAAQNGGGMYLVHSSPDMDRIIIQGNHAIRGAGIYMTQNSLPKITRSQLSENSASESGGGACVMQQSGLNIVNSLIFGNSANFDGGGFYVKEAELQMHSSSLVHQYASFGRSVFADAASLTISNSILWNNGEEIEDYDSHVAVDHSDIQMADGIFPGEGNINADPNFRDSLSDFRLNSSSPCIDAGTATHAPTTDLSGKIRPSGDAPDMGAYEWNNREPSASFYARNTTVYSGITVEFRDRSYSYDGIQSWQWDFGDGTENDSQHPIHTYETPGIYTVKLTIHESDGDTDTFTRYGYITIKGEEPTADFYANPRTGFGSLEAQFTDRSVSPQSEIVKWLWEFGDGQTSTERNPIHHYTTHGKYTVKLAVTNAAGAEHSISRYHYIQIQDTQPKANFSAYPLYGQKALTVRFYNRSSSFYDITNWHWDFGDGETSAESNPTHSYTHSGYYSVTLEVISAGGTSETFRNNYIHVFESVETFYVNVSGGQDQYTSIQSAIDVSNMGDTIIVAPGTYYETIDYKGKGITIKSSQGAEKTIIDANNIDAAVKCINGEDSGAVLRGFSVTNGFAMNGGGIYISGASSPTIIDCIVFNNQAQKEGGGIVAAYSSMPMIIDCEIKQNTARNGAGIACLNSSSASFRNTNIIENQALKNGGGVYVYYGSLPDIQSCDISNNMAQSRGGGVYGFGAAPKLVASHVNHNTAENGGGIMLHDALFPLIEETMIRENTATTGGALYLLDTSSPEIQNSLIADNQATYGGGLYVREVSTALINYSTFANNRAYSEGAGIYGSDVTEFTFRNGILWQDGNEIVLGESDVPIVEFSNVRQLEGIFSGVGNINQDPIFAGPKDYHLGLGSPCKNMGNAIHAPARDIAGVKRPVGSGFDIGAYEELNVPPVTNGKSVTTNEDRSITIQLIAEDDDDDPLTYVIVDQPENGIISGEGANVTYKPKANYSGSDYFRFKTNDSYYDSNISRVNITIIAIADAPVLNLSPTTQGNEDTEIPIPVNTVLSDTDGSEVSSPLIIWNVPEQATLSQGIKNPDGSYTLTTDQLSGLSLLAALHGSDDITLTVQVTATETANSDSATITKLIHVDIIPVADKPELVVTPNAAGNEDTAIPLIISPPSLVDQDQSEILSDITLFNIPDHVVLTNGTQNADGTWTLTSTQLTSLNLTPGQHIADDFTLTVSVTATETENSDSATTTQTISVDIIPVADIPSWVVSPETFGNEDTAIPLTIAKPSLVDQDQSEILSLITVSKIPDHVVLSAGTKNLDGTWTLTSEQLSSLSLTPGKHIADDFTFEVHVTATETENSDAATATRSISVDIIPVADKPTLVVTPITSGNEDTAIPLTIELPSLVDQDQSEILSNITLFQIPDHAVLSAGIKNDDNTWTLSPDQLTSLTLTPGEHIADDFILTASITATETENSDFATTTQTISVDIIPVADKPTLVVTPDASGNEDTDIQLIISPPSLVDQDQSEVLSHITLFQIPDHAVLSAGTKNDDASWTLTSEQLASLSLTPGKHIADDFTFEVSVTATETENSVTATTTQTISVDIIPVADKPNLVVTPNTSGNEDTAIPVTIELPSLVDQDESEVLSGITLLNTPDHIVFSAGTKNDDGSWTLTSEQLSSLSLTPGKHIADDFTFEVQVTATETENSDAATATRSISVDVIPVADKPTLVVTPNTSGNEDTAIPLTIELPSLVDKDQSEILSNITLFQIPDHVVLSAGIKNDDNTWTLSPDQLTSLTLTPGEHIADDFILTASITATETENSDSATTTQTISVDIIPVADKPTLVVTPKASGNEDTDIQLIISPPSLVDQDQSEVLSNITLFQIPDHVVLSAGLKNDDGSWTLTSDQLASLSLTPGEHIADDFTFEVSVTATETENSVSATTTQTISVDIIPVADKPTLVVTPNISGNEDTAIQITIEQPSLKDQDQSEVLSDITLSEIPDHIVFSAGTKNDDGSWTLTSEHLLSLSLTPGNHIADDFTFEVRVTATETENSDSATATQTISVDVIPVADNPTLVVTPTTSGNEDTAIPLTIELPSLVDKDQSEILSNITLFQIPDHVVLSAGIKNDDNTWTLSPDQLTSLTLTPGEHIADDFILTASITATETENSDSATTTQTISVDIIPVADKPTLVVTPKASGNEDTDIQLIISPPSLVDQDQSEVLSNITLFQIPDHVVLSAGLKNDDGSWTLTSDQLASLSLTPGEHIADDFTFEVSVTATETENSVSATTTQTISVDIIPVADKPTLVVTPNISGNEDTAIQITIEQPSLKDQDQSEVLSDITLSEIPDHVMLSAGIKNDGGTWTLTTEQLDSLTLTPGKNIADDFTFKVSITATETENSDSETITQIISVNVIPVADKPNLVVTPNASGNEDTPVQLTIAPPTLLDQDQSEVLSDITISQIPDHAVLSAGTKNADGSWTLTTEQLTSLTITPGLNETNDFVLIAGVTSTETENSDAAVTTKTIAVDIIPVNDLPTISNINDQTTKENTPTSPIQFTIGDVETEAEKLILDINSSNNELISKSRIVLKGTGIERSVILLPEPLKYGLSTINISVKDEQNGSSETSFVLTVENVVRPGDFNDDGLIELMDSQIALNIIAGYNEGIFYIEADVNGNKKVDLIDVIYIQQYINNLPGIHDPNNDKNIDLKDVIILLQYLTDISNKSVYPEVYHDVFLSIDQVIYILNQVK
jgi:parallel beta-helix repeat protein